jgi:hypothetical protein
MKSSARPNGSDALLPKTRAYHQIWVEGVELKLTDEDAKDLSIPLRQDLSAAQIQGGLRHSAAQRH